ncbi:MAG: MvdC/MvdD family ATP grasp protein, partial [Chloroflexota bacterium]
MTAETVLLVTASYDVAAGYVLQALHERGARTFRLNTDKFPSEVRVLLRPSHDIVFDDGLQAVSGTQVKSVWYRRHVSPALPPELDAGTREFCERETRAFLNGLLAALPTERWLSSPQAITLAERKPYQLMVASQLGFAIPDTVITNDESAVREIAKRCSLVAKAVSSGYIAGQEGNRAIFTSKVKMADLNDLKGLSLAPVIFQELVGKISDIRVTVVADEVFAAEILSQSQESSRIDWRATDDPNLEHRKYDLPKGVANLCCELVARLGLVFGA